MAVSGRRVTVGMTPTRLDAADTDTRSGQCLTLRNADGVVTVDIGGSGVTAGSGYELIAGAVLTALSLGPDESLYGIVAAGAVVVHVLETGV